MSTNDDIVVNLQNDSGNQNFRSDSFVITNKPNANDNNVALHGAAAMVRKMPTLSGFDVMDKAVLPGGVMAGRPRKWYNRQRSGAQIADMLREKNNPAYVVPHTFVSHGHVRDTFIPGIAAADLPSQYIIENKHKLITSIGQFVNDMSELRPIKYSRPKTFADLRVKSVDELNEMMDEFLLPTRYQDVIRDVFEYLRDLPENRELIFAHGDINGANVLVDASTGGVGIIDFEYAGFWSKTYIMYRDLPYPKLWEYINKLPRATNPNLCWNYDPDIGVLFKFMRYVVGEMQQMKNQYDFSNMDKFRAVIGALIKTLGKKFMRVKRFHELDTRKRPAPLVPIMNNGKDMD